MADVPFTTVAAPRKRLQATADAAATIMSAPRSPEQRLVACADLSVSVASAAVAMRLALTGADDMAGAGAPPNHCDDGVAYLMAHLCDLAEALVALSNDRCPRWRLAVAIPGVRPFEAQR